MFLIESPVWLVLMPFLLMCAAAYFSARVYRGTHDLKKSCKIFFPLAAVIALSFWFAGLPLVFGGFMMLAAFLLLMFFSNYFFDREW
jgi:hypothetical protein